MLFRSIPPDGIAANVKLIRGNIQNPDIYMLDLSTIHGMKRADLVLQSNDIIYIETRDQPAKRIAETLAPYASILSSFILVYTLGTNLSK